MSGERDEFVLDVVAVVVLRGRPPPPTSGVRPLTPLVMRRLTPPLTRRRPQAQPAPPPRRPDPRARPHAQRARSAEADAAR